MSDSQPRAHKNTHRAPIQPLDAPTLALTTMGLGFLRPAPGTWGSLPPVAIMFALGVFGADVATANAVLLALLTLSCVACVLYGRYAERRFGRKDAAEVVIDETAGQCLSLLFWPAALTGNFAPQLSGAAPGSRWSAALALAAACAAAFLLFRVSDILKPWPSNVLERLPHGWGVLADDLMAGVYAAVILQLSARLIL